MQWGVPRDKPRVLLKLKLFLGNPCISQKDCASLHGSLKHICFVYHDAHCALPALSQHFVKVPEHYVLHHIPQAITTDLNLWLTCLTGPAVTHSLLPRQCLDPNSHIEVSSFGLRFAFKNWYVGWHLVDGWAAEGQDIGWDESVALELAIYWLIQMGFHDADITMHLDNTDVIGAFSNRRSHNPAWNYCLHRMTSSLIPASITISPKYVPSHENLAVPTSCGQFDKYIA